MNTVNVVYVGKKPWALDNVARSGKTWEGYGSVQAVTPSQAKRLTAYKDQWALESTGDMDAINAPVVLSVEGEDGQMIDVPEDELNIPLERMTATQLIVFAQHKYNKKLRLNLGRTRLLNEVSAIVRGNDAIA